MSGKGKAAAKPDPVRALFGTKTFDDPGTVRRTVVQDPPPRDGKKRPPAKKAR
jgi:hypothetical protein